MLLITKSVARRPQKAISDFRYF